MKRLILITFVLLIFPINTLAFSSAGQCSIIMDQDSNRILFAKDIYMVRSVASISKIMTAVVAIESNKLNDEVVIGEEINDAYGSAIYIKVGEKITLKDLLHGLMMRSGNDAALAIANYVGGSVDKFVEMMNKKAKEIGMKNTIFNNPSGLDNNHDGNYSTAYDMAILTSYAMKKEVYKEIVKIKKFVVKTNVNTYEWTNKNKLLSLYKYTTGGKTGFTEIAKRTLVSTASKNDLNLVVVTLNNGNDFNEHINLYKEAFNQFKSYNILKKGIINIYDDNYYQDYNLYLKRNFNYPLSELEKDSISLAFKIEKKRHFKEDEVIGKVKVIIGDKQVFEDEVYVGYNKNNNKLNFIDSFFKWLKKLW